MFPHRLLRRLKHVSSPRRRSSVRRLSCDALEERVVLANDVAALLAPPNAATMATADGFTAPLVADVAAAPPAAAAVDWANPPATGMATVGVLAKFFLQQEEAFLGQVSKNLNAMVQAIGSGGDPFKLRAAFSGMKSHLTALNTIVANLGSGRMQPASLGTGITLDAAQIDYFERVVLQFMRSVDAALTDGAAITAETMVAADAVSTNDASDATLQFIKDTFTKLSTPFKNLGTDTTFSLSKFAAVAGLAVGAVGVVAELPVLAAAGAGLVVVSLGTFTYGYLYQGQQAAVIRNEYNAAEATARNTMNQIGPKVDSLKAKFSAGASNTAAKIAKLMDDVGEHAKQTVFIPAQDFFKTHLFDIISSVSVTAFNGTWTGTLNYTVSGHTYSDPITVKLTAGAVAKIGGLNIRLANGTMTYLYRYLNSDGTTRGTTNLTAYISYALWGPSLFNGTMKAHVPNGPYGTADFLWNLNRTTLEMTGLWVEGANSFVRLKKAS